MIRIAVVTDIHHGADHLAKKGTAALGLLGEFARFVEEARPDLVLDLGDRISDRDAGHDRALQAEVAEAFRGIRAPLRHLCGNHDLEFLTVAENGSALSQPLGHEVVDLGNWQVVLWRAEARLHRVDGFRLAEPDLVWLDATLRAASRPTLLVSHVPLSGQGMAGNYWFEHAPERSRYPGTERIRAVLARARVPLVCLAGHVHWNSLTMVDAIPHLTLQSLVELSTTSPDPAGAWGLLELAAAVDWRVSGLDPFAVRLDAAATARRPLPALRRGPG